MSVEIKVPAVGESVTEGLLSRWLKEDGATVSVDEPLFELETDKVSSEIPSPAAGVLRRRAAEGDTIEVGAVVGVIEESNGAAASAAPAAAKPSAPTDEQGGGEHRAVVVDDDNDAPKKPSASAPSGSGEKVDVVVPSVGESVTEGVLARWMCEDGSTVAVDQPLFELETDKVSSEIPSPAAGVIRHGASAGDTIEVGAVVASIDPNGSASVASSTNGSASGSSNGDGEGSPIRVDGVEISPLARRMAAEEGLDIRKLHGTGSGGRIMKTDVVRALAERRAGKNVVATDAPAVASAAAGGGQKSETAPKAAAGSATSAPVGERGTRRVPMSMLRRRIAQRLLESQQTTATLTTFNEVDMSAVMSLRKKYKEEFKERHGIGLGFMSFFMAAAVDALRAWPAVNAQIDGNDIVYHDYADIGVAVSTEKGLVVPVVRGVEALSFADIESKLADLAKRARDGAIDLSELQGGTFTITNGGVFGSLFATPIINPPQAGILGMHGIKERPVAVDGQVVVRPMMYIALSYDHRIIDGRESVSFLKHVKDAIENPERMLLGL